MRTSNEKSDERSKKATEWPEMTKSLRERGYTKGGEWDNENDDLTKKNCSPELWKQLGGDGPELTDEDYQNFLDGKPFGTTAKSE